MASTPRAEKGSPEPSARDRVVDELVTAAIELFGERGPDAVSLRDVAAKAQVNYGLIHQYVGTKGDLIRLALLRVSTLSTERFTNDDPAETITRLVSSDPASPGLRLLAWSLLQGRSADDLIGRSEALTALAAKFAESETTDSDRQKVVVLLSLILGWQLFGDYLNSSIGLDQSLDESTVSAVQRLAFKVVEATQSHE